MSVQHATIADFDAYMERKGGTAKRVCRWKDVNGEYWETACKNTFCTTADTLEENGFIYCPYCGKKIKEVK